MTARDLLNGSARLLGFLAQGELLESTEAQDGLAALNGMLDSWSTESLSVLSQTERVVTLTASQKVYTIGTGGDINLPRPLKISDVSLVYPAAEDAIYLPLLEYTQSQYASLTYIGYQTPIPQAYFFDNAFPFAQLYVYPMPQAGSVLRFWTWDILNAIPTLDTQIQLPPGYERALRYNLAIEIAPEYGMTPSDVVVSRAQEAKTNINRMNAQDVILDLDTVPTDSRFSSWNRLTGDFQ